MLDLAKINQLDLYQNCDNFGFLLKKTKKNKKKVLCSTFLKLFKHLFFLLEKDRPALRPARSMDSLSSPSFPEGTARLCDSE